MSFRTAEFNQECIKQMVEILQSYLSNDKFALSFKISEEDVFFFAGTILSEKFQYDIDRLANSDPAAGGADDPVKYVWAAYKGLKAVLHYRIANELIYNSDLLIPPEEDAEYYDPFDEQHENTSRKDAMQYFYHLARIISEDAKTETTIEINPSARIAKGFVIDHGLNTSIGHEESRCGIVIGETCIIGENCTILNGVTLGAADINQGYKEGEGRRHPKLGDGVTVCANARVFGGVDIGDGVFIGAYCVVNHDIPSGSIVSIVNQLQIERGENPSESGYGIIIWGLVPREGMLYLYGDRLNDVSLSIQATDTHRTVAEVHIHEQTRDVIAFDCSIKEIPLIEKNISLFIQSKQQRIILLNPLALKLTIQANT